MKKVFVTIMVIVITIMCVGTVKAITGVVNTPGLNLREEASTSSNVITQLDKNVTVNIIEELSDWCKVSYGNNTGYVSKQYLDIDKDNTGTTTQEPQGQGSSTPSSVVYSLPLLNSTKVANLQENSNVTIVSKVGNWTYILADDISGWIITSKTKSNENANNTGNDNTENSNTGNNNTENNNKENNNAENNNTENNNAGNNAENGNAENNNAGNNTNNNDTNLNKSDYPTTMYVNVDAVNVRDQASTDSDIIASVELNNEVTVTGISGDWYKVKINQSNGYIKKDYLSSTKKQ